MQAFSLALLIVIVCNPFSFIVGPVVVMSTGPPITYYILILFVANRK